MIHGEGLRLGVGRHRTPVIRNVSLYSGFDASFDDYLLIYPGRERKGRDGDIVTSQCLDQAIARGIVDLFSLGTGWEVLDSRRVSAENSHSETIVNELLENRAPKTTFL
jgi:hypothetical protein